MITLPNDLCMIVLRPLDEEKAIEPLWIRAIDLMEGDLVYDTKLKKWGAVVMVGHTTEATTLHHLIRMIDFPQEYMDKIKASLIDLTRELVDAGMLEGMIMTAGIPDYVRDILPIIHEIPKEELKEINERIMNAYKN